MAQMIPRDKLDAVLRIIAANSMPNITNYRIENKIKELYPKFKEDTTHKMPVRPTSSRIHFHVTDISFDVQLYKLLNKLIQDGYIEKEVREIPTPDNNRQTSIQYAITFDGWQFVTEGGYTQFYKRAKCQRRIQNVKDWLLIIFAGLAAFGSISLSYFEFLKHFVWH